MQPATVKKYRNGLKWFPWFQIHRSYLYPYLTLFGISWNTSLLWAFICVMVFLCLDVSSTAGCLPCVLRFLHLKMVVIVLTFTKPLEDLRTRIVWHIIHILGWTIVTIITALLLTTVWFFKSLAGLFLNPLISLLDY